MAIDPCDPCERDCEPKREPDCLDTLWEKLELLKACIESELANSVAGQVCELAIVSGTEAVFENCCAGTAWILVNQVYPSSSFPTPDGTRARCEHFGQAAQLEIGVVRCAPTMDDHGNAPTAVQMEQSAREVHSDRVRLTKALRCCLAENIGCDDIVFGTWQAISAQGGCVGGSMTVFLALNQYDCSCDCDDDGNLVQDA